MDAFANQHAHILRQIAELDYAPAALEQAIERTRAIVAEVQTTGKKLKDVREKTQEERAEHLDLQQSVGRKWEHKLTGRGDEFAEKAAKEEREYLDALEQEKLAQTVYEKLEADWAKARQEEHDLRGVCIEREALQEKLEALYKAVFDGPTPSFPQEDDLERILQQAQDANDREQARFVADLHVVNLLSDALDRIDAAVKAIASARGNSVNDILGLGEQYINERGETIEPVVGRHDKIKTRQLKTVANLAGQMMALLAQAQQYDSSVPQLSAWNTPLPDDWDMYFDNPISDIMMYERIKAAEPAIVAYHAELEPYVRAAEQRAAQQEKQAMAAADTLDKARRELYEVRAGAFAITATAAS